MRQRCWRGFALRRAGSQHARTARGLQRRRAELCSARGSGPAPGGTQSLTDGGICECGRRVRLEVASTSAGISVSRAGGRLAGSDNAAKVSSVPGARAAAVSTVRPRDTSPRRTCAQAASRRRKLAASSSSAWAVGAGPCWSAASRAAASRAVQRPTRKSRTRWSSASRPVEPATRARQRSRRGTSKNSFQARACCTSPARECASRKARREKV